MFHRTKTLAAAVATSTLLASSLFAGELVINTDTSDPAPKAAFEALIAGFEAENPDVKVTWNLFDHEGYKTSIRNFLTADAPDLANWYAGNRMLPYVNAGLFEPVDDVWAEHGLNESLASAKGSMTIDGKIWGVPYTYYQWGVYYRKDLFEAKQHRRAHQLGRIQGGGRDVDGGGHHTDHHWYQIPLGQLAACLTI